MKYQIYIFQKEKEEKFYRRAIDEYEKRLSRYCSISVKYLRKEKEWEKQKRAVGEKDLVFVAAAGPVDLSSEGLAARIREFENRGIKCLHFFIGPPGTGKEKLFEGYKDGQAKFLCLSAFTMPPPMTGMILSEQIYRAYRILNNQPYHK